MADLSDVENALVSGIIDILYPKGIAETSVAGVTCRVYRGWPAPTALNADLAAGVVNVTVFPSTKAEELPDPYFDMAHSHVVFGGLTSTVTGHGFTLGGEARQNQIIGVLVDGMPYIHEILSTDTADIVAASLAALIRRDRDVSLSYATLTVPGARSLQTRVVTKGVVSHGLRRQRREMVISCWCPGPLTRDEVGKAVDAGLARQAFISLADDTKAHLRYASTHVYDQSQSALLYKRDICYKCEYTTISNAMTPVMLFGDIIHNGGRTFV